MCLFSLSYYIFKKEKAEAHVPIFLSLDTMPLPSLHDLHSSSPPPNSTTTPTSSLIPEMEKIIPNYRLRPSQISGINPLPSGGEFVEL